MKQLQLQRKFRCCFPDGFASRMGALTMYSALVHFCKTGPQHPMKVEKPHIVVAKNVQNLGCKSSPCKNQIHLIPSDHQHTFLLLKVPKVFIESMNHYFLKHMYSIHLHKSPARSQKDLVPFLPESQYVVPSRDGNLHASEGQRSWVHEATSGVINDYCINH